MAHVCRYASWACILLLCVRVQRCILAFVHQQGHRPVHHQQLGFTNKGANWVWLQGVRDINFSNDGRRFLSSSYDRVIKLWDTETGQVIRSMGEGKMFFTAKFHPDEDKQNVLMAGCQDKKVYQWDMNSGDLVQVGLAAAACMPLRVRCQRQVHGANILYLICQVRLLECLTFAMMQMPHVLPCYAFKRTAARGERARVV